MIGPNALWRGRGSYLLNAPAQPKHDAGPRPRGALGRCFFTQLFFQASIEPLGVGFLVFGCGWVREPAYNSRIASARSGRGLAEEVAPHAVEPRQRLVEGRNREAVARADQHAEAVELGERFVDRELDLDAERLL